MRAIAIGAAVFLVFVAAASGSGPVTSQKPLKAPRPSGVPQKKAGVVEQVACASGKSCAAYGGWLYTEQGGKWKAVTVPALPHTGGANLRSIACPAAGRCVVVGMAGAQHLLAVTEHGRQWRSTGFGLPANAAPIKPPDGPYPFASGVSCPTSGACTMVGHYEARRPHHPCSVDRRARGNVGRRDGRSASPGRVDEIPPS